MPQKDFKVRYLFGLIPIPNGFGRVKDIEKFEDGIKIFDENNINIFTKVNLNFIEENHKENA